MRPKLMPAKRSRKVAPGVLAPLEINCVGPFQFCFGEYHMILTHLLRHTKTLPFRPSRISSDDKYIDRYQVNTRISCLFALFESNFSKAFQESQNHSWMIG